MRNMARIQTWVCWLLLLLYACGGRSVPARAVPLPLAPATLATHRFFADFNFAGTPQRADESRLLRRRSAQRAAARKERATTEDGAPGLRTPGDLAPLWPRAIPYVRPLSRTTHSPRAPPTPR